MTATAIPENYAPLAGLEDLKQPASEQFVKKKPLEFLDPLRQEMRREKESEEWRKRYKLSQKNELYFRGYQNLQASPLSDVWYVLDPKPVNYTLNEFQFWVNVNCSKANASRIEFTVKGISDLDDAEMAAKKVKDIANYYDDKTWTRTKTIKSWKGLQFTGHMIAHVFYDPEAEAGKAYRPVTDRKPVKLGNDTYRCTECGHIGEIEQNEAAAGPEAGYGINTAELGEYGAGSPVGADQGMSPGLPDMGGWLGSEAAGSPQAMPEPPTCERCGSPALDVTELPTIENFEIETGREEYKTGDVCDEIISLYNIVWNAKLGMEKSPVVLWEEDHDIEDLKATYQGINITGQQLGDVALRTKEQLEHIGGTDNSTSKKTTLSRMWIEPRRYQNWELAEQLKTYKGVVFEAGTKPIEVFPDGMHVIMIGATIVDWYSSVKNDDLVCLEYIGNPNGGLAQGCDAMCEPQRMSNTGHSLWNLWMRHHASPPKRYNPDLIDPGDISGDPTKPYPINTTMLGMTPEHTIEKAMVSDIPTPFPSSIWEGLRSMRAFIQFAAYATEFTEGLPNVNNETLGGAEIAQGLAQSVSGVFLGPYADFRCEVVKRKLKKFQQYCWDERYAEFSGKYGVLEGAYISARDIPNSFDIEPVPGSWINRTQQQRQANLQALLQTTMGIQGLLAMPPAMRAEFCEIYDVRLDDDLYPVAIRTARMRIKQMAAGVEDVRAANQMMEELGMLAEMAGMEIGPDPGMINEMPVQEGMEGEAETPVSPDGAMQQMAPVTPGMQLLQFITPPFNPREKGLEEGIDYLSTWLTTDEGLSAEPELIEAVGLLQDAYIGGLTIQGQAKAMAAMAAAGPMMAMAGPGPGGPPPQGQPKQPSPGTRGAG